MAAAKVVDVLIFSAGALRGSAITTVPDVPDGPDGPSSLLAPATNVVSSGGREYWHQYPGASAALPPSWSKQARRFILRDGATWTTRTL